MRYWVQMQAPAGNWVDSLGTDDKAGAIAHAKWLNNQGQRAARVIERADVVVELE